MVGPPRCGFLLACSWQAAKNFPPTESSGLSPSRFRSLTHSRAFWSRVSASERKRWAGNLDGLNCELVNTLDPLSATSGKTRRRWLLSLSSSLANNSSNFSTWDVFMTHNAAVQPARAFSRANGCNGFVRQIHLAKLVTRHHCHSRNSVGYHRDQTPRNLSCHMASLAARS